MQLNCASIVPKSPTSEALGMEENDDKSSYLLGHSPVYHFINIVWQHIIHRSPRNHQKQLLGGF